MVRVETLKVLGALEEEMGRNGRHSEEQALREARRALGRSRRDFLTTGQAAEQLGISIPTVKRWIERGALAGTTVGGRWLVAVSSVEQVLSMRRALADLEEEGNPTAEEIEELYQLDRLRKQQRASAAS